MLVLTSKIIRTWKVTWRRPGGRRGSRRHLVQSTEHAGPCYGTFVGTPVAAPHVNQQPAPGRSALPVPILVQIPGAMGQNQARPIRTVIGGLANFHGNAAIETLLQRPVNFLLAIETIWFISFLLANTSLVTWTQTKSSGSLDYLLTLHELLRLNIVLSTCIISRWRSGNEVWVVLLVMVMLGRIGWILTGRHFHPRNEDGWGCDRGWRMHLRIFLRRRMGKGSQDEHLSSFLHIIYISFLYFSTKFSCLFLNQEKL